MKAAIIPLGPYKRVNVAALLRRARFAICSRTPDKAEEFRLRAHIKAPTRLANAIASLWPDKGLREKLRRPRAEKLRLFPLVKLVGALKRQPSVLIQWARPRSQSQRT
jgi:hypothetical protein